MTKHYSLAMFIADNKVRMHDTDMAGILYFPRQFRFVHDAWEDLMDSEGFNFDTLFNNWEFVFVVAHVESDYIAPLRVGDKLKVHVKTEKIGKTSFTMFYEIYKVDGTLVGTAKTVHVTLKNETRTKIPLPEPLKKVLQKHLP